MRIKKNIIKVIRNLNFQLKGIGVFTLVPLLVLYVLLPILHTIAYQMPDIQNSTAMNRLYDSILRMTQYFIPLLSVWWGLFILEHYIEEPMHELLYLKSRIKLGNLLLLYVGFLVCMVPLFLVYTRFFPTFWWLFLKLAILNLFYLASAYCGAYLFGKIIPASILVLLYTVYIIMEHTTGTGMTLLSLYEMVGWELIEDMWGYIAGAVLLLIVGGIANYYYPEKANG